MLVRSGISAPDDNLDVLRDSINGWFADLQDSLLAVPTATVMENTTLRPNDTVTNRDSIANPTRRVPSAVLFCGRDKSSVVFPHRNILHTYESTLSTAERLYFTEGAGVLSPEAVTLVILHLDVSQGAQNRLATSSGDFSFGKVR